MTHPLERPPTTVLSPDDLGALGHRILSFTAADVTSLGISHVARATVRVSHDRLRTSNDGDELFINANTKFGQKAGVWWRVNRTDDTGLRELVAFMERMAREQPGDPAPREMPLAPRTYLPQTVWFDQTVDAMNGALYDAVPTLLEAGRRVKLHQAAFIGASARSVLYLDKQGLNIAGRATDAELTLTEWNRDGEGSGWAGASARDWRQLDATAIADSCQELTLRSAHPVAFEPGRRVAILGPAAVVQLVRAMAYAWGAYETIVQKTTPFWDPTTRHAKLGRRVMSDTITITSHPNDPDGGYLPFFDYNGYRGGMPLTPMTWIERGVLKHLAFDPDYAASMGVVPANDIPFSMRLSASDGVPTVPLDDMIAVCKEGIYVNRFSNVEVTDSISGMMTGVTRDGCFLVQHGKITKALKNFRFSDSPFLFLNRIEAIGRSRRTALGYAPPGPGNPRSWEQWPLEPIIVPPLMVNDFNFSGLAAAV